MSSPDISILLYQFVTSMLYFNKRIIIIFLNNFDEKYTNKENTLGTSGIIILVYINLLFKINNEKNKHFISPGDFANILDNYPTKFNGKAQKEAHEFINYLLDKFYDDLNLINIKLINNQNNNIVILGNNNPT